MRVNILSLLVVGLAAFVSATPPSARTKSPGESSPGGPLDPAMDSITRVHEDLREATDMMRENLAQVVDRGEHLELLVDKSDGISNQARQFQKQSTGLRKAMWWKNVRSMLTLAGSLVVLLMLVLVWRCGFSLSHCKSSPTGGAAA